VLLAVEPASEIDRYLDSAELAAYTGATVTDPGELRQAMAQVAADGYCLIDGELEEGLVALAVPLCDADGAVIAPSTCAPTRSGPARPSWWRGLPLLRTTAVAIEAEMRAAIQLSV
jgi:IclR family transcriptional regulator, pca regulon regulatory protein